MDKLQPPQAAGCFIHVLGSICGIRALWATVRGGSAQPGTGGRGLGPPRNDGRAANRGRINDRAVA